NACRQRDKIEEENGRAEINAKTHEAIDDQVNRDQNHADASIRFHGATLLDRPSTDNHKSWPTNHTKQANEEFLLASFVCFGGNTGFTAVGRLCETQLF